MHPPPRIQPTLMAGPYGNHRSQFPAENASATNQSLVLEDVTLGEQCSRQTSPMPQSLV